VFWLDGVRLPIALGIGQIQMQWGPIVAGIVCLLWGCVCLWAPESIKLPDGTRWLPLREPRRRMTPREVRVSGLIFVGFGIVAVVGGSMSVFR
jgi:hypothetical protein